MIVVLEMIALVFAVAFGVGLGVAYCHVRAREAV